MAEDEFTLRKELEKMKLHEEIESRGYIIQRVIDGWIYWRFASRELTIEKVSPSVSNAIAGVFVPEK